MFPELWSTQPMFPLRAASYFSGSSGGREGGAGAAVNRLNFPMPLQGCCRSRRRRAGESRDLFSSGSVTRFVVITLKVESLGEGSFTEHRFEKHSFFISNLGIHF